MYIASREQVQRYTLKSEVFVPENPEVFVKDLGRELEHSARSLAIGEDYLYINIGGPSNVCQKIDRMQGISGQDPCPQLEGFGGIYRFSLNQMNQTKTLQNQLYATGIRNAMGIDWNPNSQQLYATQHGRDQINQMAPKYYSMQDNAERPAEELFRVEQGDDFGWPYCYFDNVLNQKILNPEYGGDKKRVGRCKNKKKPWIAFPAHYAPNDLLFYKGSQFPKAYRKGAFIAFHGSWNRYPADQEGYNVVFVPADGNDLGIQWFVFADGFAGKDSIKKHSEAKYRPMGLAEMADGSLLIADSVQGKIWQIRHP